MLHTVLMDHIRIGGANEMLHRGDTFDAAEREAATYAAEAPHLAELVSEVAAAAAPVKTKRAKAS